MGGQDITGGRHAWGRARALPVSSTEWINPFLARAAAARVRDALAQRTAPPVVLAVREERLTRLAPSALADLRERMIAADARSSAREVQVFGVADRKAAAAGLTRHGFRPETTRVTLCDGAPAPDADALGALVAPLAARLVEGGVLIASAGDPGRLAAVEAAFVGADVRYVRQAEIHVVREG